MQTAGRRRVRGVVAVAVALPAAIVALCALVLVPLSVVAANATEGREDIVAYLEEGSSGGWRLLEEDAAAKTSCPGNCSGNGDCQEDGTCDCAFDYSWSPDCSLQRKCYLDEDVFEIYVWTVLSVYAVLELLVLGLLAYVVIISWPPALSVQPAAYLFVALAYASRIVYFSIDPGAFYGKLDPWLDRLLRYILYPFLFTAYTMVLYFWAASNWRASMARKEILKKLRMNFVAFNVFLYSFELLICLLQHFLYDDAELKRSKVLHFYEIYLSVILVTFSIAFIYYGTKIYLQLRQFSAGSMASVSAIRKVTFLTIATSVVFLTTIAYNLIDVFVLSSNSDSYIYSDAVIQVLGIVASLIILALLGEPKRYRAAVNNTPAPQASVRQFGSSVSYVTLHDSKTMIPQLEEPLLN